MSRNHLVFVPDGSGKAGSSLVGGKGANLALLESLQERVPPWYAVTTEAFTEAMEQSGLTERIDRILESKGADGAGEIQEAIRNVPLPEEFRKQVNEAHARVIPEGAWFAVRSSASDEDAAGESFAGLHDSYLFVRTVDDLHRRIRDVWASAFNERALAYRQEKSVSIRGIRMAVVVQEMVDAAVSGVAFTAHPVTGNVHQIVISSVYGSGEGLVSAGLPADLFAISKKDLAFDSELADKEEALVHDGEKGGLRKIAVEDDRRQAPSIDEEGIRRIAKAAMNVERLFGRPQDIEFSLGKNGALYLLQSRAVTTVEEYGPAAGNRQIWDNSNIIESYSGVTSPMTFSFIRHAYTIVYHCFSEVMGIDRKTVHENRTTFENMLGLFRGQVYYNLRNWYRLVRLFPGFQFNRQFMESMMGVRESMEWAEEEAEAGFFRRFLVELPALLRLLLRSTWNFVRIRKVVGRFEEHFRRHYDRWDSMDFHRMAPHELMALYRTMEDELLWKWKAPIINDFFVMIFYGTLKKLCVKWCGDDTESLQNDLLCGEGDVESTKPTKMLLELARTASMQPELRTLILDEDPDSLVERIPADPRFASFSEGIERYLRLYGFRCMNELKLEEFSLRDRPAFVYGILRNYLAADRPEMLDVTAMEAKEREIRREAEKKAFSCLGPLKAMLFRRVLRNARLGVKNRENMRFARTRIYGLLREMIRAIGARFAGEGLLDDREEIFYLTIDEMWDTIKGTAVSTDLKGLVAVRRKEFDAYRAGDAPDDRFETYGIAYHANLFRTQAEAPARAEDGSLNGIGCCPGVVEGPVKVMRDPSGDMKLAGEILVAGRTDPGWVPFYPSVSGLLIERGSILSHSAIVAREMGIPTIVGIPGLLDILETGQRVKMDGSTGRVEPVE